MNDRTRQQFTKIFAIVGSTASAMTVAFSRGNQNILLTLLLATLAGTAGHLAFTGLGILLMRLQKRWSPARPGSPVYAFYKLPVQDAPLAGGKGRALAQLTQAGFPVPDGCVLLTRAFAGDEITPEAWSLALAQIRRLRRGKDASFAVRSSALSEDSAKASFAGEFDSILNVSSDDEIRSAIHTVRQSRHNDRVLSYTQSQGLENAEQEVAVVIQKMVQPDFAGVLFTADPLTGNLMRMTGNFVSGLGDKLVSGEVSASAFTIDRSTDTYQGPTELQPMAKVLQREAHEIEARMGCPQDIEWAITGKKLHILQSRPITTLSSYNPMKAVWNDSLKGHLLWSANNLMEAYPEVLTPFTASLNQSVEKIGGPSLTIKGYPINGIICGRMYTNLGVQVSAFARMFKGDTRQAYRQIAGWWGEIPEGVEIPLIPLTKQEWERGVLLDLWKTERKFRRYRRNTTNFLANNQKACATMLAQIQQAITPAELAILWQDTISLYHRDCLIYVVAASSDIQVRLEKELRELAGPEDANAMLSNLSGTSSRLESLGPAAGLGLVASGQMSREDYLTRYGHRGENEAECAWPRPMEDPSWLDRRLAEWRVSPADVEGMLARQRKAFEAAWGRFYQKHPAKIRQIQKRLDHVSQAAQRREQVRSEATRAVSVARAFALRAGEMLNVGEDIFFLTIDEVLAALGGDRSAIAHISVRKETHRKYAELPPYPAFILGRFEPFAWAADPQRRSDFFDATAQNTTIIEQDEHMIRGAAGALGVVEGTVRRLERLDDSAQFLVGEVLVTNMTNIGWTPLFPRAAAIVTDLGAPLSHAAIVARELGIPAVVGCGNATSRLKTGDRVRVDGGKGLVEILS